MLAYYDRHLEIQQRYRRVPGVQAAVRHGAELVYSAAFGHADLANDVALGVGHLFRIASHSKTFTSTAIMQLVQAGRLRLDDTAGHWVPFLVDDDSPLAGVTVRDLLTHAAGVYRDSADGDFWHLVGAFPDRATLREILATPAAAVVLRTSGSSTPTSATACSG